MKTLLHVGCGPVKKSQIPGFKEDDWTEIRFDIDKNVNPDIEGTLTDMSQVETGSVDAIYSSHNIEHVYPHEVPIVLNEFYRVLRADGMVVVICPDLQSVCESVVIDNLIDPLYISPEGPISPLDMIYGNGQAIKHGNEFMAHKCGFTYSVLDNFFADTGFETRYGGRRKQQWDLFIVAFKQAKTEDDAKKITLPFL
tara:strand:+ start:908 stop:1498 length:591 start_codon:yes stop_codon:yes gene_type:complete